MGSSRRESNRSNQARERGGIFNLLSKQSSICRPYKVIKTDPQTTKCCSFRPPPSPTGIGRNKEDLHNHLDSQLLTPTGIRISCIVEAGWRAFPNYLLHFALILCSNFREMEGGKAKKHGRDLLCSRQG